MKTEQLIGLIFLIIPFGIFMWLGVFVLIREYFLSQKHNER